MNLEPRKVDLISWITNINSVELINMLEHIRDEEDKWWETIPTETKKIILESENQADSGNLVPHDQVLEKYKKYLK